MAKTTQTFTGNASQLLREQERLLKQQVKLEEQMRQVTAEAKKIGRQNFKGVDAGAKKVVGSLANMVTGYLSVQGAIQLVNAELEKKRKLETDARDTSVRAADAEAQVAINIGDVGKEELKAFIGQIGGIREDAGFQSVAPLLEAAATTLSATAGDQKLTADVLKTVAPIFKSAPDDLATAAQVVGDLAGISGRDGRDTTGLILSTQAQARITNLEAFKNVAPAIAAAVATQQNIDRGVASREAAAAFAAIGNQIKDPDGSLTKTAVASLSVALERNFEIDEEKFKKLTDQGVAVKDAREQSALSFAQRLDLAQATGERISAAINQGVAPDEADTNTVKDLLSKGFRGPVIPVIRELLAGNNTEVAKAFDRTLPKIAFDGDAVDRKIDLLASATQNLTIADADRNLAGSIEGAQLQGELATIGAIRKQLTDAFDATGNELFGSTVGKKLAIARFEAAGPDGTVGTRADLATEQLQERIAAIEGEPLFFADRQDRRRQIDAGLSDIEREEVAVLKQAIRNIDRLAAALESNQNNPQPPRNERANAALQHNAQTERD